MIPRSVVELRFDERGNARASVTYSDEQKLELHLAAGSRTGFSEYSAGADSSVWQDVRWFETAVLPDPDSCRMVAAEEGHPSDEPIYAALLPVQSDRLWAFSCGIYRLSPGESDWRELWSLPIFENERPLRILGAVLVSPITVALDLVTLPIQGPMFLVIALWAP